MEDNGVNQARGVLLRQERLRRQLTLAQVEQQTRIRERYLAAIEDDDYHVLPAPVFAIGLITKYAKFLGLDPEPFVTAFKKQLAVPLVPKVQPETARIVRSSTGVPGYLWPAFGVVFLLALVGYLYQQVSTYVSGASLPPTPRSIALLALTPLPSPTAPPPTATSATLVPTSQPLAQPSPTPTTPPVPTATLIPTATPQKGVRIDAAISGRVWMQVEADGKVVFSGILQNGDKHTWRANRTLMIWSGDAGNVSVTYNGKPLGPLGRPGEVVRVTWTATA
ncbi:MAG TPA: RodZ domain-containing protein [Chloroflexota bacterium]|nr:RodZ domain-containing protein [Chloroflexota bacterium]